MNSKLKSPLWVICSIVLCSPVVCFAQQTGSGGFGGPGSPPPPINDYDGSTSLSAYVNNNPDSPPGSTVWTAGDVITLWGSGYGEVFQHSPTNYHFVVEGEIWGNLASGQMVPLGAYSSDSIETTPQHVPPDGDCLLHHTSCSAIAENGYASYGGAVTLSARSFNPATGFYGVFELVDADDVLWSR